MTPREAAEKRELELLVDHLGRRNFQNAGDAAELKAALEAAVAPKAEPTVTSGTGGGGGNWVKQSDFEPEPFAGDSS
jgi:hypothetical protein